MTGKQHQTSRISLQIKRTIDAPIERVFDAWSTPQMLMQWWRAAPDMEASLAEIDFREGGTYRLGMKNPKKGTEHICTGKYLKIERPTIISFTWRWEGENEELAAETIVTITLCTNGDATDLVLSHERLPSEASRGAHEHGWNGCLNSLEEYLQQ